MRQKRRFGVVGVAVATLGLAVGVFVTFFATASDSQAVEAPGSGTSGVDGAEALLYDSNLDVAGARAFSEYALYWLNESFRGLPLTGIARQNSDPTPLPAGVRQVGPAPGRIDNVTFLYGTCDPGESGSCQIPLQIQVWPACQRNLDDYMLNEFEPLPHQRLTVRGVPAAQFDDRLELYSGEVTVVIFGEDATVERAAATALAQANGPRVISAGETLPAPVDGALEGEIAGCGR